MAQTIHTLSTSNVILEDVARHNENYATLKSSFSGTDAPANPVNGQKWYKSDTHIEYTYINGEWKTDAEVSSTTTEVVNARGSKDTLDQRLDVIMNEDGTLKSTATSGSQWVLGGYAFTYVSSTVFKTGGNTTDIFVDTRRVKVNLSGSYFTAEITGDSTYDGGQDETTVTIDTASLDATLVSVEHSLIAPYENDGALSYYTREEIAAIIQNRGAINVKDYGAVGDGVTDDTAAIQSALNVGGSIFIPNGNYQVTSYLAITQSNIEVYGENGTVILCDNLQTTGGVPSHPASDFYSVFVIMDATDPYNTVLENITIRDLTIQQEGLKSTMTLSTVCRTIESQKTKNLKILNIKAFAIGQFSSARYSENIEVSNNNIQSLAPDTGVYADAVLAAWDGIDGALYFNNRINGTDPANSISTDTLGGFSLSGGTGVDADKPGHDIKIIGNTIRDINRFGIWMDGRNDYHYRTVIEANAIHNSGDAGIRVEDLDRFTIANNIVSENGGAGLVLQKATSPDSGTGCHNGTVNNNLLYNNDGRAIQVSDSSSVIDLSNNTIIENLGTTSFESQIILDATTSDIKINDNYFSITDDVKVVNNSSNNPLADMLSNVALTISSGISSLSTTAQIKHSVSNDVITISGYIGNVTPTLNNNYTAIDIALPIPLRSDLNGSVWVTGTGVASSASGRKLCDAQGVTDNSTARIAFVSGAADAGVSNSLRFSISYVF